MLKEILSGVKGYRILQKILDRAFKRLSFATGLIKGESQSVERATERSHPHGFQNFKSIPFCSAIGQPWAWAPANRSSADDAMKKKKQEGVEVVIR